MRLRVLTITLLCTALLVYCTMSIRPFTQVQTAAANAAFMQGSRGEYELSANEKVNMLVWSPTASTAAKTATATATTGAAAAAADTATATATADIGTAQVTLETIMRVTSKALE
jgi:hypothetical protein